MKIIRSKIPRRISMNKAGQGFGSNMHSALGKW